MTRNIISTVAASHSEHPNNSAYTVVPSTVTRDKRGKTYRLLNAKVKNRKRSARQYSRMSVGELKIMLSSMILSSSSCRRTFFSYAKAFLISVSRFSVRIFAPFVDR